MNKRKDIVPNKLREYRIKAGLTQKQLAKIVGVNSAERISHWETGNNVPRIEYLLKLGMVYKTSPKELYPIQY
jgi:transcriptional regulator with XRE-family HTH domain